MADLKRLAEDATTKAAIAAGKDAARRALDDIILSDEEKAKRDTASAEVQKRRRWKYIALAVLGLCLVVGVVGLMLKFWTYFLFAGVLGTAALYGWWRLRKRRATGKSAVVTDAAPAAAMKAEPVRVVDEPAVDVAAQRAVAAQEARERAEVQREARAEAERQIDDELAAMKAKLRK